MNYKHLLILTFFWSFCEASRGDSTSYFKICLHRCVAANCTTDGIQFKFTKSVALRLFKWSCKDDCKYECMWRTVDGFQKYGEGIPQFFGKWPFVRFFGIQEPASTLFSIFNLIVHYKYISRLKVRVGDESLTLMWKIYALVNVHAWIWSAIFHARDTPFTETMDYVCAFSIVVMGIACTGLRMLFWKPMIYKVILSIVLLLVFVYHAHYLTKPKIDYNYNMFLNVTLGALGFLAWIVWGLYHKKQQPYCWKILYYATLVPSVTTLEILDIEPIFWVLDAHALWHFATWPIHILFYSFVIDDNQYLKKQLQLLKGEFETSKKNI